jgi:hypothetical protein
MPGMYCADIVGVGFCRASRAVRVRPPVSWRKYASAVGVIGGTMVGA